jgi:hypothetical protein
MEEVYAMTDREIILQMSEDLGCDIFYYDDWKVWERECIFSADFPLDWNPSSGIHALCEDERVVKLLFSREVIDEIPSSIGLLSALVELGIFFANIESLPDSIGRLSFLKKLRIDGCDNINNMPTAIGNLSALEKLDITYSKVKERLPESIGRLTSLRSIDFWCSSIEYLPESLGNLVEMEELLLYNTSLIELPDSIGNLSKLKILNIERTKISKLPASIGNLAALRNFEYDTYNTELADEIPESLKGKFYYSSYFDFFLKKCKTTELLFACQIYFKDGTFKIIEKDLDALSEVDERQILYFKGYLQTSEYGINTGDDYPSYFDFAVVDSISQKSLSKGCYSAIDVDFPIGADNHMNTYMMFSDSALYDLVKEGIPFETVETLIPKLYQHYDTVLKPFKESHRIFLKNWECGINDFYKTRGLRHEEL